MPHIQRRNLDEQALHGRMGGITLTKVTQADMNEQGHMCVIEAVKHLFASATALYQAQSAQDAQMLRDSGLRDARQLREIAGAQLILQQAGDNAGARGIAERGKDSGEITSGCLIEHARPAGCNARVFRTRLNARS